MLNKFVFLIFMIVSTCSYAQKKNSYVFFSFKNDTIKRDENFKLFFLKGDKEEEIKPIETNLYLIKNKRKKMLLKVDNKLIYINLKNYKKERFFNITLNLNIDSKGIIYDYKRGDAIKRYNECNGNICDTLVFEFPQIILLNEQYTTTINDIFAKYIFD